MEEEYIKWLESLEFRQKLVGKQNIVRHIIKKLHTLKNMFVYRLYLIIVLDIRKLEDWPIQLYWSSWDLQVIFDNTWFCCLVLQSNNNFSVECNDLIKCRASRKPKYRPKILKDPDKGKTLHTDRTILTVRAMKLLYRHLTLTSVLFC